MRSEKSSHGGSGNHDHGFAPEHRTRSNEDDHGDTVGGRAEQDLQGIHLMNVRHAEGGQHGKDYDPHPPTEVASVNCHQELEAGGREQSGTCAVASGLVRTRANELASKQEEEGSRKHQPGQDPHEGMRWGAEEKHCANDSSKHAGGRESSDYATGHVNVAPEGPTAE